MIALGCALGIAAMLAYTIITVVCVAAAVVVAVAALRAL